MLDYDSSNSFIFKAAILISCFGVFGIATHIQRRFMRRTKYIYVQILTLFIVSLLGIITIGFAGLAFSQSGLTLIGCLLSIPLGYLSWIYNNRIVKNYLKGNQKKDSLSNRFDERKKIISSLNLKKSSPRDNVSYSSIDQKWLLLLLILTAIFEEIIYRGIIVSYALLQAPPVATIILLGSLISFTTAHLFFGDIHILAKLPLSVICLISYFVFYSILPCCFIHAFFNYLIWKKANIKNLSYYFFVYKK